MSSLSPAVREMIVVIRSILREEAPGTVFKQGIRKILVRWRKLARVFSFKMSSAYLEIRGVRKLIHLFE